LRAVLVRPVCAFATSCPPVGGRMRHPPDLPCAISLTCEITN
jgi:hypothetical protein